MSTARPYTVLEIGSGSFKLHRNGSFSTRFQSSLGKGLVDNHLDPASVTTALTSIDKQILPFLKEHEIDPREVKVFATAAVRQSMTDIAKSGEKFLSEVKKRGFEDIRVFSVDQECEYAAWAVIDEIGDAYDKFLVLDTGGASHQLIEIETKKIIRQISIPIGSHSDLTKVEMPKFSELGFGQALPMTLLGTSGLILGKIPKANRVLLREVYIALESLDLEGRREFLKSLIEEKNIYPLLVDYRLQVLPNAFRIIYNCANNLNVPEFVCSTRQAMDYVSHHGFR